ncbi:Hsp70/Hsp90 co-chaperone-like protein [Emericellopsis cladophorae]|uniref:Hsp70/Hsp90 co-chaperone-like protein n=1 Tax=Emericellopsis cladophorae TaxID=2686198 RepID=A0A9Q0BH50_9HYPO|nr:Hsp70/Hsp90 co-chaperone-like protein [Emericellopsis cladophorae]KAI6785167.1 Hsp70/Hsp90 co-chaperone-like protein [Emericellopsis cladophorae]
MDLDAIADQVARTMGPQQATGPASNDPTQATRPQLPPGHALHSNMTVDEVVADLNKSPLFMTEYEENDDTAALQALAYEGSPLENGSDFKEKGNEYYRAKLWTDANEFYTKGIQVLAPEEKKRQSGELTTDNEGRIDSDETIQQQRAVLESLYGNRAACHLELKNYRSCWIDCAAALRLNPKNVKAYYRSARALLAVGRIEEADDVCARGLALDENNASLKLVADDIVVKAKARDAKRQRDAEREALLKRREYLLKAALKARNIPTRTTDKPPEMEDTKLELVPDPDDPRSTLSFPTVLLYPKDLESDFIKAFNEMQTLEEHLGYVFPLPWDKQGRYTTEGVECYVETREGGLLKMGKRVTLLKVLGTGKVEVVDGVVRIFVLPKAQADEWVKTFKEQKKAIAGKA